MTRNPSGRKAIPCLKVRQWLPDWNKIRFDEEARQKKPAPHFYLCSMNASELKALTGVYRRKTKAGEPRALDPNVQRGHEEDRSKTIRDFVRYGYPWCDMSDVNRRRPESEELRKPGWLPTAIIVNVLPPNERRHGKALAVDDVVTLNDRNGQPPELVLPAGFSSKWAPSSIYPLEVIDGQHRLWAFEDFDSAEYELPVVLFSGLDHSWQAYLFWSVNITPKRINRSLAFDLYPLLRRETWLDRLAGHSIYRETRCQELTEALWRHSKSPWYQRINMLGEKKSELPGAGLMVTQAAWVRSLMATFVKPFDQGTQRLGGLFGAPRTSNSQVLPWTRAMQSAFLIFAGISLLDSVKASSRPWAASLRKERDIELKTEGLDPAFYGRYSLLSTDQGIRCVLHAFNDLCFVEAEDLKLESWTDEGVFGPPDSARGSPIDDKSISTALTSLEKSAFSAFVRKIAQHLATYDWRTSAFPGLSEKERLHQAVFRGSSGYREMRLDVLNHLKGLEGTVAGAAAKVLDLLS